MALAGKSLIGFSTGRGTGASFHALNPATGTQLEPSFISATQSDVDAAARLASDAFAEFGQTSGKRKSAFLRRIAERIETLGNDIVERANLETALPVARLQSELGRTCNQLRMFADLVQEGSWVDARIDHPEPARKPVPKPDIRSMLRPLGPVAVFGSSNFPLAFSVSGGDTASALAAGCPVIVKAHPAHPGTSELVAVAMQSVVREFSLPEGTFSLLFDAGYDVGLELVRHPSIKAVGFTGSRKAGHALMSVASSRPEPVPVYAEMGSINPVFLLPGAIKARSLEIASGLHASVTLGVGQFCTNPGLVFLQDGDAAQKFLKELERLIGGTAVATMLTSGISTAYRAGVDKFARTKGVQVRARVLQSDGVAQGGAVLFTTDAETFLSNRGLMDEVFGPSTIVVLCKDSEQLVTCAQALEGQLTATIHATDEEMASHKNLFSVLETKVGRLVVNGFPTGVEVCHSMVHGGPYPATSDGRSTSVGTRAIQRFTRPVCYQNFSDAMLPDELKQANPPGILRLVNGKWER